MSRPAEPLTPVERALLLSSLGHREAARALAALKGEDRSGRRWNHSAVIYHRDRLTRAEPISLNPTLSQSQAWMMAAERAGTSVVEWLSMVADRATERWVLSSGPRQGCMSVEAVYATPEEAERALQLCGENSKVVTYLGPKDAWCGRHGFGLPDSEGGEGLALGLVPLPEWPVRGSAAEIWGQS